MISLSYTEAVLVNTATVLINRPCQVKKLRLVFSAIITQAPGFSAAVIVRDGGATGTIMGRLLIMSASGSRVRYSDTIECKKNEILQFNTNVFVQVAVQGAVGAVVGAYTMASTVGTQGS